jgi:hypothetical protein
VPAQIIAPSAADEPGTDRLTKDHPLAAVAARLCQRHPAAFVDLVGGVACGGCWSTALFNDFMLALECGLPLELDADPSYIDQVAVERALRGEALDLTAMERTEVRRRLAAIRSRRNQPYRFVCSRAAAARRAGGAR